MHLTKSQFTENPQQITESAFDCVWVRCASGPVTDPLKSAPLQWLDWVLQGQISRWWIQRSGSEKPLTIATLGKLPTPFVVLDTGKSTDIAALGEFCQGIQAKEVLLFCEETDEASALERELKHHKFAGFPEKIVLGSAGMAGRS